MANTTIYPYGTNGQLPSTIWVINDLTTGGADKALSAGMGKTLRKAITGLLSALSPTAFTDAKITDEELGIAVPVYQVTLPSENITATISQGDAGSGMVEEGKIIVSLVPHSGFSISNISVTMTDNGTAETLVEGTDYSLSDDNGVKTIVIFHVTGDVTISASTANFNISYYKIFQMAEGGPIYLSPSSGFCISPLIEIPDGTTNLALVWGSTNRSRFCIFYDSDGYRTDQYMNNSASRRISVPSGAKYLRMMYSESEATSSYITDSTHSQELWRGSSNEVYGVYTDFIKYFVPQIMCQDGYKASSFDKGKGVATQADKPSATQYTTAASVIFDLPGAGAARSMTFFCGEGGGFYNMGSTTDSWSATANAERTVTVKAGCSSGALVCNGGEEDLATAYVKYQSKYVWWGHSVVVADEDIYVEQ